MWAILFIIAGVVLKANEQWFNGASTAGIILLVFGIVWLVLWSLSLILAATAASSIRKKRKW